MHTVEVEYSCTVQVLNANSHTEVGTAIASHKLHRQALEQATRDARDKAIAMAFTAFGFGFGLEAYNESFKQYVIEAEVPTAVSVCHIVSVSGIESIY